jgi:5-hydroxyisourate hydrolase
VSLSTHVLDTMSGRPAVGVRVRLDGVRAGVTDEDGRLRLPAVPAGVHRLSFDTADYFAAHGVPSFHPEVVVAFTVEDPDRHYHVPLLAGPYAYTTYRGS